MLNGQKSLKINQQLRKKFIYLISPPEIKDQDFFDQLRKLLSLNKISFFQLRVNKFEKQKIIFGEKIRNITKRYRVKFLVNDDPILAKKLNADGCHLGQKDMDVKKARKILGNKKIIGVTCHNSKFFINKAVKENADYVALGSFFKTKTKKIKHKANLSTLKWCKNTHNLPIVAIGGINNKNYKKLLLNQADFLAISGYIWKNKKFKPEQALKKLKK